MRDLSVFCEPRGRWRRVESTERRTSADFAEHVTWFSAWCIGEVVRMVLDNPNSRKFGSQRGAYEPVGAPRIARKKEFHYIPKRGSCLIWRR